MNTIECIYFNDRFTVKVRSFICCMPIYSSNESSCPFSLFVIPYSNKLLSYMNDCPEEIENKTS